MKKTSLNKILLLSTVLVFSILVFVMLSFSSDNGAKAEDIKQKEIKPVLTVVSPKIPEQLDFSGEETPLDIFYVRESFDRELLVNAYWHSSTILLLKRANRWFPVIEPILRKNNIPDDFKYLAMIESGFTKVVSPKGAAGYWQFLEKTAREYQLEVNNFVDERYHVEKSTEAACSYFKESYEIYQNWTLVAASYNAGNRRISESIENQRTDNYYDLYLNEETSRYVFRILAIKTIYKNPKNYGFELAETDLYPTFSTEDIGVVGPIENLVDFAKQNGMNYRLLKEYNPWLQASSLPNSTGKQYFIKVIPN